MPLAFESKSHGTVAFGFFNIDSDMLLLEHYFFFSTDFCQSICALAEQEKATEVDWPGYFIEKDEEIGDLMGAIHGVRHLGFLGELYRLFPFPERSADFRQKPEGTETQQVLRQTIAPYASTQQIPLRVEPPSFEVKIADLSFTRPSFHQLLNYVWRGGYPRWRDEQRPDYLLKMKEKIKQSNNPLFADFVFDR